MLDKARAASKDYFNKNENYRTFARAAEWFSPTGWPGPVTAAAAEVQASNVLTDAPAKVIVDKWSVDQAIDWADKKIKEIYDTIGRSQAYAGGSRGPRGNGSGRHRHRPAPAAAALRARRRPDRLPVLPGGLAVLHRQARRLPRALRRAAQLHLPRQRRHLPHGRPQQPRLHRGLGGAEDPDRLAMALVLHATWRWRNFFRGLLLLPWITSTVIIALTWRWMFDAFPGRGFFNSVLLDAGLLSRPIAFMATPEGAMAAVVDRQLVARLSVLRRVVPGRHAVDPGRAVRGGLGRRRRRVAALLAHHAARAQARDHRDHAADVHLHHQRLQHRLRHDARRPRHRHPGLRDVLLRGRLQRAALGTRRDDLDLRRPAADRAASRWSAATCSASGRHEGVEGGHDRGPGRLQPAGAGAVLVDRQHVVQDLRADPVRPEHLRPAPVHLGELHRPLARHALPALAAQQRHHRRRGDRHHHGDRVPQRLRGGPPALPRPRVRGEPRS